MARSRLAARLKKRWWFGIAYRIGVVLFALRLIRRPDRYIDWMVRRGTKTVIEAMPED
ncbi:hypothetical protein V5F89_12410 [Pelagerythrobacter marensis]|uniref:Lipid A biosynthesis lauroyl acyltransferase n=1 Tax=Pelagerythrobacter marensis TaxID=543877 RepID=A0ABZ2D3Z4_9SPHN